MSEGKFNGFILNDETLPIVESMAEGLPGGFFIYHADGDEEFIYINSQMLKIMGCKTKEEFRLHTGNSFKGLVHPDDIGAIESVIKQQIDNSSDMIDRVKYRVIKTDGQLIWIDETGHFVHTKMYGDIFYVFVIEVTDEYNHEIQEKTECQLKMLDALCHDYVNVYLVNMKGKSVETIKLDGHFVSPLSKEANIVYDYAAFWANYIKERVHPEDAKMLADFVQMDALKESLSREYECIITYRIIEGEDTHYYQVKFIKLDEHADMKDSVLVSFQNMDAVVEKKLADAKELENTKNALEAALNAADKANTAKTDFFFNLSHDIRTPMNAIIGFTDLLKKYEDDKDKRRDYIGKIQESSRYLLELINNVLEMARIENGKMTINESVWNIEHMNEFLESVFSGQLQKKNIHFTNEVNLSHPYILCDTTKVKEIFFNLISNAIKYTPDGGSVGIRITEIPSGQEGYETIKTVIEDTGIGMSEDFLPRIFEGFARDTNSEQNKILGTGLGMSIVKKMVDLMKGSIDVESELGKGTIITVILTFKIASEGHEEAGNAASNEYNVAAFKGKRILLTEDDEFNAEISLEILRAIGFEVERAENGEICIDMLQKAPDGYYSLILMDILMPKMNGYQTARKIRSLDNHKRYIPIIAMTANAFEEDKQNALDAGMNGHIAKPIEKKKLVETLAEIFKSYHASMT